MSTLAFITILIAFGLIEARLFVWWRHRLRLQWRIEQLFGVRP